MVSSPNHSINGTPEFTDEAFESLKSKVNDFVLKDEIVLIN